MINKNRGNLFRAGEAADVRWVRFLKKWRVGQWLDQFNSYSLKPLHSVYIDVTRGVGGTMRGKGKSPQHIENKIRVKEDNRMKLQIDS